MRNVLLAMGVLAATAGVVSADSKPWAEKLFDETTHDFGTVPRGIQLKHRFTIKNIYKVPLTFTNVKVSCGCLKETHTKTLQPNEVGYLDVVMDASRFSGQKSITISATVGPQYVSTATLHVTANARPDVVLNPGRVEFGIVQPGTTPTQTIDVEYSGSLDWKILEVVKNASAPFSVVVNELYREGGGRIFRQPMKVGYRFIVTLKPNAAAGLIHEDLLLKTNDPASPVLTIPVEGRIQSSLVVAPQTINLNKIKVGETQIRKVVLRGQRPFSITSASGEVEGMKITLPKQIQSLQVVELHFNPKKPGDIKSTIEIVTDLGKGTVQVEGVAVE